MIHLKLILAMALIVVLKIHCMHSLNLIQQLHYKERFQLASWKEETLNEIKTKFTNR